MKLISEIRQQFSFAEWFRAFWNHVPTAGKITPKGGVELKYPGGSSQEIHNALVNLKKEVSNKFSK